MHRFDTEQLVVKVKIEILSVNELWFRFLWNITSITEKQDLLALYTDQQKTYAYVFMYLNVFSTCDTCWKKCVNFKQFVRKQRRVELKSVGKFVAKTVLLESAKQFSLEELCRTDYILKYFLKPYRSSDPLEKP